MFSENGKISQRQLYRMIVVATLGASLLICPRLLGMYGGLGLLAYLLAGLMSFLYILIVFKIKGLASNKPIWSITKGIMGTIALVRLLAVSVGGLYIMYDVVRRILLPRTNGLMILLLVGVLLVYWMGSGLESTARAMELLFYWVLVPIVISLAVAVSNVNLGNIISADANVGNSMIGNVMVHIEDRNILVFLFRTFIIFIIFTPADIIWLCKENSKYEKMKKPIWKGFSFFWTANVIAYGIILGIYGARGLNVDENYPLIKVMQISGVPGDFLRRVDGFMGAFLVVSLFCGVVLALVIIKMMVESLPKMREKS